MIGGHPLVPHPKIQFGPVALKVENAIDSLGYSNNNRSHGHAIDASLKFHHGSRGVRHPMMEGECFTESYRKSRRQRGESFRRRYKIFLGFLGCSFVDYWAAFVLNETQSIDEMGGDSDKWKCKNREPILGPKCVGGTNKDRGRGDP